MVIVGSRVGMYIRTCMRSPDVIVAIRACFLLIQSNTSREALSSQRAPFLPLASPHPPPLTITPPYLHTILAFVPEVGKYNFTFVFLSLLSPPLSSVPTLSSPLSLLLLPPFTVLPPPISRRPSPRLLTQKAHSLTQSPGQEARKRRKRREKEEGEKEKNKKGVA